MPRHTSRAGSPLNGAGPPVLIVGPIGQPLSAWDE